jgi:hypothetical protein
MAFLDADGAAAEWCRRLPPRGSVVEALSELFLGLTRPPRLELSAESLRLFPDCPGLDVSRASLEPRRRAALSELTRRELRGETDLFALRELGRDGTYRLSGFAGDPALAETLDARPLVEALARAAVAGSDPHRVAAQDVCRAAILNALLAEGPPEPPPDVSGLRARCEAAARREREWRDPPQPPQPPWPPPPPPPPTRRPRRFMRPMPPRPASAPELDDEDPSFSFESLERELESALVRGAARRRALELRTFARSLVTRLVEWR